jgi:hypothetical protein
MGCEVHLMFLSGRNDLADGLEQAEVVEGETITVENVSENQESVKIERPLLHLQCNFPATSRQTNST